MIHDLVSSGTSLSPFFEKIIPYVHQYFSFYVTPKIYNNVYTLLRKPKPLPRNGDDQQFLGMGGGAELLCSSKGSPRTMC